MNSDFPKFLIAPLNWGLGHASRSIPIISLLRSKGIQVSIASDGDSLTLLESEFPDMNYFELPSFGVNYKGQNFTWNILKQTPKFIKAIKSEHRVIQEIVRQNKIDVIVSDNRYGCYDKSCYNIFVSHQSKIKSNSAFFDIAINKINKKLISQFEKNWIPDYYGEKCLAGELSQSKYSNTTYIGPLSRMTKMPDRKKYDIAIVLSGPEPKRTYLEKKLIYQSMLLSDKKIILIQGLMGDGTRTKKRLSKNLEIISFLNSKELNEIMSSSHIIVARSGYSTIMDLWKIQKPALLIPTQDQPEQTYLAEFLNKKKIFLSQSEAKLDLKIALNQIKRYTGFSETIADNDCLEKAVNSLLKREWFTKK